MPFSTGLASAAVAFVLLFVPFESSRSLQTLRMPAAFGGRRVFGTLRAGRGCWRLRSAWSGRGKHFHSGFEHAREVPVGALVTDKNSTNDVMRELRQFSKLGVVEKSALTSPARKNVLPFRPHKNGSHPYKLSKQLSESKDLMSLHLSPMLAWALSQPDFASRIPSGLLKMIEEGRVVWIPGLRTGSNECLGSDYILRDLPKRKDAKFYFVELFAGIGGFRVALDALGGQCVMASETDALAKETYSANFGDVPLGDITEIEGIDIPDHDLLTAGFPCQAFTITGKQKGFADPNGNLFFEVVRVLKAKQPKAFLLENVPALETIKEGQVLSTILEELQNSRYLCSFKTLRSNAVLPQKRRRVYFVGIREDIYKKESQGKLEFDWPETLLLAKDGGKHMSDPSSDFPTIRSILEESVDESYTLTPTQWSQVLERQQRLNQQIEERLVYPEEQTRTLISSYRRSHEWQSQFVPGGSASGLPRFFTEREFARLQGFPDTFNLNGCSSRNRLYHQLGNAVSPPVIGLIAEKLLEAIGVLE